MKTETIPFDGARYLTDKADQIEFLAEAMASGKPDIVAAALGLVARAIGMTTVAKQSGVTREALYRALSPTGDPCLSTLLGVTKALGFKLVPVSIEQGTA